MDVRLILVKSITLLYQDSQLDPASVEGSKDLITKVLKHITIQDSSNDTRNPLASLRSTLLWMLKSMSGERMSKDDLLQRIRIDTTESDTLYIAISNGLAPYEDIEDHIAVVRSIRRLLTSVINVESLKGALKEASHTALFKENQISDWTTFKNELIGKLGGIDMGGDPKEDGSFVATVDMSNRDSIEEAFRLMNADLGDEGSLRFPWQAMNRMFGGAQGARRGEFHLYPALPHNYKSGWLLDIFVGLCLFNTPYLFDKNKKPAIIFISTEDVMAVIIAKLYLVIQQWLHGYEVAVDIKNLDIVEATDVVMKTLSQNGWNVFMHQIMPSNFTYTKYFSVLEDYKSKGYEVAAVVFDYLSMCNKSGCSSDIIGDDIQDLFRRVREYTSKERILQVTAHQLSTQAKEEKRISADSFIHKLPGGGYYERSKKLDTELDFEAFLNIVKFKGTSYLEVLWGKHRKLGSTSEKDKYFVLPFLDYPMHGVGYDVGREDTSYTKVGGKPATAGGGSEWFDLDQ